MAKSKHSLPADPSCGLLNNNLVVEPEAARGPAPEQRLQDRIHFIFNNVSIQDLMIGDLSQALGAPETHAWFADYIVTKRAAVEENFQPTYLAVLTELNNPAIDALVLAVTYRAVKQLLVKARSADGLSAPEKNRLKNLGKWLGAVTIGASLPMLQRDLCLKDLIVDAFDREQLELVLPFVSRVLSAVPRSKLDVNNVWLRSVLRLLAEIYALPNLKLPLKFEIELLCQQLNVELASIKTSGGALVRRLKVMHEARRAAQAQAQLAEGRSASASPAYDGGEAPAAPHGSGEYQQAAGGRPTTSIHIDPEILLFRQYPQLKKHCPAALDRALREIITPVVERSATIACITTRELVAKDFPVDGELQASRTAAHHMVRNLAGNLALVTCKEVLRNSISTLLRSLLTTACQEARLPVAEATVNAAVQQICLDNIDLACAIVEKKAVDKAVVDIDDMLARPAAGTGLPLPAQRQPSAYALSLPEALRSPAWSYAQSGQAAIAPHHLRVYEDFGKLQSSLLQQAGTVAPSPSPSASPPPPSATFVNVLEQLAMLTGELSKALDSATSWAESPSQLGSGHAAHGVVKSILALAGSVHSDEQAHQFLLRVWSHFADSQTKLHHELWFLLLQNLCTLPELSGRLAPIRTTITRWLLGHSPLPRRGYWLKLIASHLVHVDQVDAFLAAQVAANAKPAVELSIFLLLRFSEVAAAPGLNLPATLQQLQHLASGDTTVAIALAQIQKNRQPSSPASAAAASSSFENEVRAQAVAAFEEWLQIYGCEAAELPQRSLAFLGALRRHAMFGHVVGAELALSKLSALFVISAELAVAHFKAQAQQLSGSATADERATAYRSVDALVKLVLLLLKGYYADGADATALRLGLLGAAVTSFVQALVGDHDAADAGFDQRPYYHLFAALFEEVSRPAEPAALDDVQLRILFAFSNGFLLLSPQRAPGFVFAWLELVSRKHFMPKLLAFKPPHQAWTVFEKILLELFKFLEPHLRHAQLSDAMRRLYKGSLRVLLVLLHDFPEFLCEHHFALCDVLPPACVQMRNLILSAFPRTMRLLDPFTPHLKVDLLPEIAHPPRLSGNFAAALTAAHGGALKQLVDRHLQSRMPASWTQQIGPQLLLASTDAYAAGTRYNVPLINSLVLYLGAQMASQSQGKPPLLHTPAMDIFQFLVFDLDPEGRYFAINAIANQLRYPNNHTHYFSCVLLVLFAEAPQEVVQEQITRVLLERVIVNRPHPWGLLITFIELIKNPQYRFWSKRFVTSAPEFKRLFESVLNLCK